MGKAKAYPSGDLHKTSLSFATNIKQAAVQRWPVVFNRIFPKMSFVSHFKPKTRRGERVM